MNLVWFLTVGAIFSTLFGEFGKYPFGAVSASVSLTDITLSLAVIFLLIWQLGIKANLQFPKYFKMIAGFWAVCLISLLFSGNLRGGLYLIRFVLYSFSFYLGYTTIQSKVVNFGKLINTVLVMGAVFEILGFLQLIFLPNFNVLTDYGFDPHQSRLTSSFLDPNFAGVYLNIFNSLALYLFFKTGRRAYLGLIAFFVFGLILTFSRSAYLMLVIQLIILGLFKMRKILVVLLIGFLVLLVLVPRFSERVVGGLLVDKSAGQRIESWQNGLIVFESSPALGVGFDNLRDSLEKNNLFKVFSSNGGHSGAGNDSSFIFVLATTGVLGFLVYGLFWLSYLFDRIYYLKSKIESDLNLVLISLLLSLLVEGQFINSLFFPAIMLLVYLLFGASVSYLKDRE